MKNFKLQTGIQGYLTAPDPTTIGSYLVAGSQNVLIDRQKKFGNRAGYSLLGALNTALTPVLQQYTWNSNTNVQRPVRFYDDELEVWLGTVDGVAINAWTRVKNSITATKIGFTTWWDTTEKLDLLLYVIGDATMSEWGGGVAVVDSITGTTITKKSTTTFAQNRFYTTRNKVVTCVRTGTEYTYTGGETTTTLTGIADTTGLIDGDILIQKVIVQTDHPIAGYKNTTIFTFQNQIFVGNTESNEVYFSKNSSYHDFAYSAPRIAGEGGLVTLDAPCMAFGVLGGKVILFSGRDDRYVGSFDDITVGTTLSEQFNVTKYTGTNQGAQSQDVVVSIGDALAYLSYEPALYILESVDALKDPTPKPYSNPIKPDFDNGNWDNAQLNWANSRLHLSAPEDSKLFILEFIESADKDGQPIKIPFWQPPQILPIRAMSIIDEFLHFSSNAVPETYKMFDELSDGYYEGMDVENKIPIKATAKCAYFNGGKRGELKCFDEFFVEGEISKNTTALSLKLNYELGGALQNVLKYIDGSNPKLIYDNLELMGIGQPPLGGQTNGGAINEIEAISKFRVIVEIAKEDFYEIQEVYETDGVDLAWSILSRGPNATISPRKDTVISL
jgi:hypothetical protein